jgi:hypothetical protein
MWLALAVADTPSSKAIQGAAARRDVSMGNQGNFAALRI